MGHEGAGRCDEIRELLSAFLEGDLEAAERRDVEMHIDTCEDCAADLALLRQTLSDLREIPELPAPAAILAGVREGIRPRKERWAPGRIFAWRPRAGFPVGAAATILVAFGIFLLAERFPELGKAPAPMTESLPEEVTAPGELRADLDELRRDEAGERNEGLDLPDISAGGKPDPEAPLAAATADQATPLPSSSAVPADRAATPSFADSAAPSTVRQAGQEGAVEIPAAPADEPQAEARSRPGIPSPDLIAARQMSKTGEKAPRDTVIGVREEAPPPVPVEKVAAVPVTAPPPPLPAGKMKRRSPEYSSVTPPAAPAAEGEPKGVRKKSEKKESAAALADDEEDRGYYRKSIPRRSGREAARQETLDRRLGYAESPEQEFGRGKDGGAAGQAEILTILSFTDDEVRQVRESIANNGGTLLEMENLDAAASQQAVLPYQVQVPDYRNISRGWQVRALVPAAQVEELVSSLRTLPRLQLLERIQVPDAGRPVAGATNIQINLLRQGGPAPAAQ